MLYLEPQDFTSNDTVFIMNSPKTNAFKAFKIIISLICHIVQTFCIPFFRTAFQHNKNLQQQLHSMPFLNILMLDFLSDMLLVKDSHRFANQR